MEKKFYVKNDPKVILEEGDKVSIMLVNKNNFIKSLICTEDITNKFINFLKDNNFIEEDKSTNLAYYVEHLAYRMKVDAKELYDFLIYLSKFHPMAFINVLLREIALVMDDKYKNHIKECDNVYVLSSYNGEITKVPTSFIRSFKGFAAFRTYEEADKAKYIMKDYLAKIYNE